MSDKLCIKCEHYTYSPFEQPYNACRRGDIDIDIVTGNATFKSAEFMRMYACGEEGKMFEPRISLWNRLFGRGS